MRVVVRLASVVVVSLVVLVVLQVSPSAGTNQAATTTGIPNLAGKVLTVVGPVDPEVLGQTIMHEHIFIDFQNPVARANISRATDMGLHLAPVSLNVLSEVRFRRIPNRDNLYLTDFGEAIDEVMEFKRHGGQTIVDVTSIGLGRDPHALQQMSQTTGLSIVMGAGWYQKQFHPADMDSRTIEELTDVIVRDIVVGAQGTSVRSGIIGEVGINGNPLTANEMKSIRASARASRITGAAISFHVGGRGEEKFTVLEAVAAEGADLRRVIMGHSNSIADDLPFMKRLLERGVFIQFDTLGRPDGRLGGVDDGKVARGIVELIEAGYADRVLLSQDVCNKIQLKKYGGTGFSYVLENFLPALRDLGVEEEDIHKMMVENPVRALTFAAPVPSL